MSQKLSEILSVPSEFNLFGVVATLEPFDPNKLEAVVSDLLSYCQRVEQIFVYLAHRESNGARSTLEWLAEGKNRFYDVHANIDSIDSIVLQALNVLESNMEEDSTVVDGEVFNDLDKLSALSLKIKQQYLIPYRKKIDLAGEYNEIFNTTMNSINRELENCLKKCFMIHERRYSSPVRHAPTFNLEMLTKKLLQQRSNLRLPLLNEIDNELYQEYLELKMIVDPLRASLNFIPGKLEEFQSKHNDLFESYDVERLTTKYNSLIQELDYLQKEVDDLKYELVDSRWNEIFSYLNTEVSFLVTGVEKELNKIARINGQPESTFKTQVLKRLKYTTDIVENTFTLINQAIDEKLIDLSVVEKSNELADRWLKVKDKIPEEYLERIENADDETEDDISKNFKKLSLDRKREPKHEDSETKTTPEKEKRRSRAGQFLMGKMNLFPVMIEKDPTSVSKIVQPKPVLGETFRHNQLQDGTPSKIKKESIKIEKIPNLEPYSSISHSLKGSHQEIENFVSPIKEEADKNEAHDETLRQLLGEVDEKIKNDHPELDQGQYGNDVFQSPMPKRNTSDSSVVITKAAPLAPSPSKNYENFKSRIPRPVSRMSAGRSNSRLAERLETTSRMGERSYSSLGSRFGRPATSQALSRANRERPESRISRADVAVKRHSMLPHTPIKQTSVVSSSSRRRSLLPQPTPMKDILERSAERSTERSSSRLMSGRRSDRDIRPGSKNSLIPPPPKPIWK